MGADLRTDRDGPKEAAESYARYVEEIVPLLIPAPVEGKAAELLANLDEIRQLQLQIATQQR